MFAKNQEKGLLSPIIRACAGATDRPLTPFRTGKFRRCKQRLRAVGWAVIFLFSQVFPAASQHVFEVGAQVIARSELRRGYQTLPAPDSKAAFFTSQRTRLLANYSGEHVKVGISLQDVRVWGDEPQVADLASTGLHEGWVEVSLGKHLALKAGRQEVAYDDHRLLGDLGWVQQARSHDALLLKFQKPGQALHFGAAYNQTSGKLFGNSDPLHYYKVLAWGWFNKKMSGDRIELSYYGVTDGFAADTSLHRDRTFFRATTGPMLRFSFGKIKASVTAFGQFGQDALDRNIAAFLAAGSIDVALASELHAAAGYELASGNTANTPANENHRFSTLYATGHKFYGYMDYFLDLPTDTHGGGLQDIFLKMKYQPGQRTTFMLDAHYFLLAHPVEATAGNLSRLPLGTELDFTLVHKIRESVNVQLGYSIMLGEKSLEYLGKVPGASAREAGNWFYLMLSATPTLFKSEK